MPYCASLKCWDTCRIRYVSLKSTLRPPHTAQTSSCLLQPLCCLSSEPFGTKVVLNTQLRCSASSTVACGSSVKDAGPEVYARNSLYFQTISDKNSCILNMQQGITKRTQINLSWTDIITASLMSVLQNMKTRNEGTECVENQCAHSILPLPHTQLIR